MKIFITGATGFIGANLSLKLAESGQTVHALFRSEPKASVLKHSHIRIFKGDILDKDSLMKGMDSCDRVYHLGAFAQAWCKDPDTYYEVNVVGTKNVLDAAIRSGVKRIVVTSTAGVVGPSQGIPVDECSVRTIDFCSAYESSKSIMEKLVTDYADKGVHVVLVNPTRVYGPGLLSQSNSLTKIISQYVDGKWRILPGDGRKIGNYAYIDDIVSGHLLAMEKGRPGERYILGGINASYSEFFRTLAEVSGKNFKLVRIPLFAMVGLSSLFLLWAKVFGRPPLITPAWVKRYLLDWTVSSQKAEEELGYSIISLELGLRKTLDWMYDEYPQ